MTPEEIRKIIEMLAEKLGPMAQTVWGAYLRQAYLSVIQDAFGGLFCLVLGLVSLRTGFVFRARRQRKKEKDKYARTDDEEMATTVSWIVAAVLLLVVFWFSSVVPFRALNLEYNALVLMLESVR